MKAEIKSIHSPDEWELETWVPETRIFTVLVRLLVNPVGKQGVKSLSTLSCAPQSQTRQQMRNPVSVNTKTLVNQ